MENIHQKKLKISDIIKTQPMNLKTFYLSGILVMICLISNASTGNTSKSDSIAIEQKVTALLNKMTLEEKVDMISGVNTFYSKANIRLGIPSFKMTDGPLGVHGPNATAYPAGVCMAATWNADLIRETGAAIGSEAKAAGKNVLLGPTMNIHRLPGGGRNFESFGEDPFLASRMAVSYINGVQSEGVIATAKHFACNNQEYDRLAIDVQADERTLNEIYFPAFKASVQEANCQAIMGAYNRLNGHYTSASYDLLTKTLKKDWGFNGFVMSDWNAVHAVKENIDGGMDIEMPGGDFLKRDTVMSLIRNKLVTEDQINDKVRRMLRVMFTMQLFDSKPVQVPFNAAKNQAIAQRVAEEGMVLLKNERQVLPMLAGKYKTIAVIGPNADKAETGGGGSSHVKPAMEPVSPLNGLKSALGSGSKIVFAKGVLTESHGSIISSANLVPLSGQGKSGLSAEYYINQDFEGNPYATCIDSTINFEWNYNPKCLPASADEHFSVRWTGFLKPSKSGTYMISSTSDDGSRLYLDNKLIVNNWSIQGFRTKSAIVTLEAGKLYPIKLEYFENTGYAGMKLEWELISDNNYITEAVRAAQNSEVAVVFAGLSEKDESEGWDNPELIMPYAQDELISAVAAVNKNTVVVLFGGIPLNMTAWIDKVAAVVQVWYPGESCGTAIANVLTGKVNPSGKLPVTFVKRWEDSPAYANYPGSKGKVDYAEGIYVGYRFFDTKTKTKPLFAFGHGLSYTHFTYSDLKIEAKAGNNYKVSVTITNNGNYNGSEVVQLYVSEKECSVDRPVKELKAFSKVFLQKGETKTVDLLLDDKAFAFYHPTLHKWTVEKGVFDILVGSASDDIRSIVSINLQ
jgi:beta-glucosidase